MKHLYQKSNKVFILEDGKPLIQMKGGVIVTCKVCGMPEIVKEGSYCDKAKLCKEHATEKIKAWRPRRRW